MALATVGYVAPYPRPIFSPIAKPATLVTGRLADATGTVRTGPSGTGCHTVVGVPAGEPMLTTFRVSSPAPVPMVIVSPADMPVVLLTRITASPARAGAASPEFDSPRR